MITVKFTLLECSSDCKEVLLKSNMAATVAILKDLLTIIATKLRIGPLSFLQTFGHYRHDRKKVENVKRSHLHKSNKLINRKLLWLKSHNLIIRLIFFILQQATNTVDHVDMGQWKTLPSVILSSHLPSVNTKRSLATQWLD